MKRLCDAWELMSPVQRAPYDGSAVADEQVASDARGARTLPEINRALPSLSTRDGTRLKHRLCEEMVAALKNHPAWERGLRCGGFSTALKRDLVKTEIPQNQIELGCKALFQFDPVIVPNPPGTSIPHRSCTVRNFGAELCAENAITNMCSTSTFNLY